MTRCSKNTTVEQCRATGDGFSRVVAMLPAILAVLLACGCATVPAYRLPIADRNGDVMRQIMNQKNRLVHLSEREAGDDRPLLVLLHGATDDPTEMMDIARLWSREYNVFLYSFNPREEAQKIGGDLVREFQRLRALYPAATHSTVVVYSYSAIVFRAAVVNAEDAGAFSRVSLVQLVPTAGGSRQARWMAIPIFGRLAALASKVSEAENPYGRLTKKLWDGEGNRKFYATIPAHRVRTILVEGDTHSLADFKNKKIQRRFNNGVGLNVVTIPKCTGVTHEYFPIDPVALTYVRGALESLRNADLVGQKHEPGVPAELAAFHSLTNGRASAAKD